MINDDYIDQIKEKIDFSRNCEELAEVKDEALGFVNDQMAYINEEMGKLAALLITPSGGNIGELVSSIVNWIQTYINLITAGQLQMMAQLAEYTVKLTELQNSLSSKSSSLDCL